MSTTNGNEVGFSCEKKKSKMYVISFKHLLGIKMEHDDELEVTAV
jgi:hypothetical protein